ncbi:ABC transporter substrate-binding protein [Actinocorallia sp. A-T 12471]|uniref:ABC transporter substrate-binding protein n=1 Tax=Actinocorallia sp. A-T 12471 TaxID=3089813 RepID=UPI0029D105DA|nr:ABC transporter substrate-binding protein [Actinocorallia sp. A-T 12471]MDX6744241.1 ABC transporter substrate-binding protein [Actinocorallia sp. A-T 12471]
MPATVRALTALVPLLLLPACASDASPAADAVLAVALPADPGCLDPQQTGQLAALDVSRSLVDTLTDQDPETGEIVPWLAQEFKASPDGKSFSFVLREGVTFSDGTPLDSDAVKATFDRLIKFPANGAPAYLRGYQGTDVADARRFTVTFDAPNAQFLQATSGAGFGILSPKTATADPAERCRGGFVGSGPFVLDHYTANQEIVIKRREGYAWPSSLAEHEGEAKIAEARFVFVPEAGARTGALASGQVHVAQNIQAADRARFEGGGFRLLTKAVPGLVPPLSLNHAGVLGDQRLRAALLVGVDRQALVDTVLGPQFKPATSVLSSTTPFYADRSDLLRHDPDRAKKLLDEAGWKPGPDGIRTKDGKALKLVWLIPAPTPPVNELVQQQLRTLGIDVELRAVPPAKYVEQQQKGEFDMTAVAVTRADPDVLRNIFATKGANLWRLPPSDLDSFLDAQAEATDDTARKEAVDKAVTWILEHADTVPLYENALVHAVSAKVDGLGLDASTRLSLHDVALS